MRAKKMGKGTSIIGIVLVCVLALGSVVFASTVNAKDLPRQDKVLVNHNGQKISLKNEAFIDNEVVFVPLRETLNLCGITNDNIAWDEGAVTIVALPSKAEVYINSDDCFINGMVINLMGASQLKNDTTFVPIDFFDAFEMLHEELGGNRIFESLEVFNNTNNGMIKVYPNEGYAMSNISPDDISFNAELSDMDAVNAYKNKIIQLYKMNSAYNSYFLYDMNGDGVLELFVGWRKMHVYTYENNVAFRLGEIYNDAYKLDGEDGIYTYGGFGTGAGGTNYFEIENDILVQKKGRVNLEYSVSANESTFKHNDEIISEEEYNSIVIDNFNEANLFILSTINITE